MTPNSRCLSLHSLPPPLPHNLIPPTLIHPPITHSQSTWRTHSIFPSQGELCFCYLASPGPERTPFLSSTKKEQAVGSTLAQPWAHRKVGAHAFSECIREAWMVGRNAKVDKMTHRDNVMCIAVTFPVTKHPGKSSLWEEGFGVGHSCLVQSIMAGEGGWGGRGSQGSRDPRGPVTGCQEAGKGRGWRSAWFL